MFNHIRNLLPPKLRKIIKRWLRLAALLVAIAVSLYHIGAATSDALRTKLNPRELSIAGHMSACVGNAGVNVGTALSDGLTVIAVAVRAFYRYFRHHIVAAFIAVYALGEIIVRIAGSMRWCRRWRRLRRLAVIRRAIVADQTATVLPS